MIDNRELPIGFTMELAQHSDSLITFSNMSRQEKNNIIERAKNIQTRQEMRNYVASLSKPEVKENEPNKFF